MVSTSDSSKLFSPLRVGGHTLTHRIVMAPMTRLRATNDGVVTDVTAKYYSQRSKVPGTLIISEAAAIAAEAGGFPNLPGMFSDAQVAGWKRVVDAVHTNGSCIYLQISALGRVGYAQIINATGHPYVSSSPIKLASRSETPVELSESEVKRYVNNYAEAARKAVHEAGFDGVELHACNGGLDDQFIQDVVNKRTDQYGGSIETRSRFVLEIIDAIVQKIGVEHTGIRFSPWSIGQDMGMRDPIPTQAVLLIPDGHPHATTTTTGHLPLPDETWHWRVSIHHPVCLSGFHFDMEYKLLSHPPSLGSCDYMFPSHENGLSPSSEGAEEDRILVPSDPNLRTVLI